MATAATPGIGLLALALTVPGDERYVETVHAVSLRVADYVGYGSAEVRAIADAVSQTVRGVVVHELGGDARKSVEIRFATGNDRMEIDVRYAVAARRSRAPLERWLSTRKGTGRPLEAIRRVMDRVEFGRDDGTTFCRLTRRLP